MKILVVSPNWNDQDATGNTYSNWFGGERWEKDDFSCLCSRMQKPSNTVCRDYYRITDIELAKKAFSSGSIGTRFTYDAGNAFNEEKNSSEKNELKMVQAVHKHPMHILYYGKEVLNRMGRWVNERFIAYLQDFQPDIVFLTASDSCAHRVLSSCIRKYTRAKIVLFVADDNYGRMQTYPAYRRRPLIKDYIYGLSHADKIYGASELLCAEYSKMFGVELSPLYKGCELSPIADKPKDRPLRFVYAGNLFYGRDDTLEELIKVLVKCGGELEIYTSTAITPELEEKLNVSGVSRIMGCRPYDEIKAILNRADVVLHVESFQQKQIDYVHYSFSTKICDCLQSGSASLVIGPAGIASVEYMRNISGVRVVDDPKNIETAVREIIQNRDTLAQDAARSREYAIKYHDLDKVRASLHRDFEELLEQ